MASRRHFQKTFQARMDELESHVAQSNSVLIFYMQVVVQLLAFGLAHLITTIGRTQVSAQQLIQKAIIESRKEEAVLSEQIQAVRDMDIQRKA
jgi:hypothetical protein